MRGALALAMEMLVSSPSWAHDGVDPASWFESLRFPCEYGTNGTCSCCNNKDCEQTKAFFQAGEWHAMVRGQWKVVPGVAVVNDPESINGEAWVCLRAVTAENPIRCFVPPRVDAF